MSKYLRHTSCDKCGSSDANAVFDDGHTFCYSCLTYVPGDGNVGDYQEVHTKSKGSMQVKGEVKSISDRNITKDTCAFYGVTVDDSNHYYPYTDEAGHVVAQKIRTVETKSFSIAGDFKKAVLFGQNFFPKGGKYLTICEGELDALAAFQMMGSKYPVVSVRNGAQAALKDCKDNYDWINSFEKVVLCFDADIPGRDASSKVAELFGAKVAVFKHTNNRKDACDYLKDSASKEFVDTWWRAEEWTPDGIIAGSTLWDEVNKPVEKSLAMYPWAGVNEVTYGLRSAELVTVTAGSGLGKSQFLREILWYLLQTTDENIGCMFLEESVRKTARSIMSLYLNVPLHLPDVETNERDLKRAFDVTLGTDRLFFWDNFGSTSIDNVINRIRFLAKAKDCKFIFLDHISMIVSAQTNGSDERKTIDELMTKLRMLVQETEICLVAVSHLKRPETKGHEEGAATSLSQLRGSGSIAQLSDMVIGLVRNAQHEDIVERNTTRVSVIKNRFSGMTSPHCASLLYNKDSGRMLEIQEAL